MAVRRLGLLASSTSSASREASALSPSLLHVVGSGSASGSRLGTCRRSIQQTRGIHSGRRVASVQQQQRQYSTQVRLLNPTIRELLESSYASVSNRSDENATASNEHGSSSGNGTEQATQVAGGEQILCGWVKSVRRMKRVTFVVLADGSTSKTVQAVFRHGTSDEEEKKERVDKIIRNGASVRLRGTLRNPSQRIPTATPSDVALEAKGREPEFVVNAVEYVGDCPPETYPLQKKELSAAYLRDYCHLRTRTNKLGEMIRVRHQIQRGVQDYFDNEGFLYVHPPVITSNDCEGAGEAFSVYAPPDSRSPSSASVPSSTLLSSLPHEGTSQNHNTSNNFGNSLDAGNSKSNHLFFNTPAYLTVSTQLHLEALAHSHERVYTIGPAFRAEYSQTGRHLAEFWMLEAEWSWAGIGSAVGSSEGTRGVGEVCDVVEAVVKSTIERAVKTEEGEEGLRELYAPYQSDLDLGSSFSNSEESSVGLSEGENGIGAGDAEKETIAKRARRVFALYSEAENVGGLATRKWPKITYTAALRLLSRAEAEGEVKFESGVPKWGEQLGSEHERWLAEKAGLGQNSQLPTPVFVTHYPRAIKPFYMRVTNSFSSTSPANYEKEKRREGEEGETVECFDLLIPGIGELAGGSLREERLKVLDESMRIAGLSVPSYSGVKQEGIIEGNETRDGDQEFGQYSWYRDLRVYGGAPHGGFGMGVERLVMALTGSGSVRECIPVPRWAGRVLL